MSDRILTNYVVEPTTLQPFLTEELDFMQDSITGLTTSLAQGLSGAVQYSDSPFSGSPYIVSGQMVGEIKVYVTGGVMYDYEPCWIYVPSQNEIFYFQGGFINDTLGEHFQIVDVFPNAADPITFSDGSQHNVMQSRRLNIVNSGGTGTTIFDYSDLQSLRGDWITVGAGGAPAYQNSWGGNIQFKYNAMTGNVQIQGSANNGTTGNTGTAIFTLPAQYRPPFTYTFIVWGNDGSTDSAVSLIVESTGEVVARWIQDPTFELELDAFVQYSTHL